MVWRITYMNHKFEPNVDSRQRYQNICARVKSHYIGSGHPTFNRESSYWGYKHYYGADDHLPLYGNNGSLDQRSLESSRCKYTSPMDPQGMLCHPNRHNKTHLPTPSSIFRPSSSFGCNKNKCFTYMVVKLPNSIWKSMSNCIISPLVEGNIYLRFPLNAAIFHLVNPYMEHLGGG